MSTVTCKRCLKEHFSRMHLIDSLPFFTHNIRYTSQSSSLSPHPLVNTQHYSWTKLCVRQWNQYHHTGVQQRIQHLVHFLSKVPRMHQKVIRPYPLSILTCPFLDMHCHTISSHPSCKNHKSKKLQAFTRTYLSYHCGKPWILQKATTNIGQAC